MRTTTYTVPRTTYLNRVTLQLQKRSKTANINVKKPVVNTRERRLTRLKLQKIQKSAITQQHIDT